jgi:hypothetical protein
LKAFIAYDAIVDPEHPLAVDDGGLKAYLGTTLPSFIPPFPNTGLLMIKIG